MVALAQWIESQEPDVVAENRVWSFLGEPHGRVRRTLVQVADCDREKALVGYDSCRGVSLAQSLNQQVARDVLRKSRDWKNDPVITLEEAAAIAGLPIETIRRAIKVANAVGEEAVTGVIEETVALVFIFIDGEGTYLKDTDIFGPDDQLGSTTFEINGRQIDKIFENVQANHRGLGHVSLQIIVHGHIPGHPADRDLIITTSGRAGTKDVGTGDVDYANRNPYGAIVLTARGDGYVEMIVPRTNDIVVIDNKRPPNRRR